MSSIAKAIGPLVNIALLLLFAIIIFAIVGLEFYSGALNKTCYDIRDPRRSPVLFSNNDWVLSDKIMTEEDDGVPCAIGTEDSLPVGSFVCTLVLKSICWPTYSTLLHINCSLVLHQNNSVDTNICSLKGTLIKYSFRFNESICLEKWEGPNKGAVESFTAGKLKMNISIQGITSFDNIGLAMLTTFQCVTMEGWTPIMYWVGRSDKIQGDILSISSLLFAD